MVILEKAILHRMQLAYKTALRLFFLIKPRYKSGNELSVYKRIDGYLKEMLWTSLFVD